MKFVGVDDRNAAELLVKKDWPGPARRLVPLKKGQHYIYDILDSAVYDLQGHELGKLTDVLRTGSNDVYVVTADDGKETLLAAIPDVIKSIDEGEKKIVVDPPEWVDE